MVSSLQCRRTMLPSYDFFMGLLIGMTIAFVIAGFRVSTDRCERCDCLNDRLAYPELPTTTLNKQVRVLVWVMTSPQNLHLKAKAVRDTWGRRADKLLFFSSQTDRKFPAIGLNVSEGREHLTAKTMQAFRYIYEHHLDDADWFMKVDDDTYVIMENLRYFLSGEDSNRPVYFGHHLKYIVEQGYYSGGAGYVLSKEALRRFGESSKRFSAEHLNRRDKDDNNDENEGSNIESKGDDHDSLCAMDGGAEDIEMGKCMERLGVRTSNTTDAHGRSRFHCFDPERYIYGEYPGWYVAIDANGARKGVNTLSDYAISFHYVTPLKMQALEYYVYHLNAHGFPYGSHELNKRREDKQYTFSFPKQ